MERQQVLDQITEAFGSVPEYLEKLPDPQLEHTWGTLAWYLGDSKLTARDKALVGFGAAATLHCPY